MAAASPIDTVSSWDSSLALAPISTKTSTVPSLDMASPAIQFTTIKRLFDEIDRTAGDALTVHDVSVQQFAEIEKTRDKRKRRFRFHFSAATKILIITIPTGLHEQLHHWIQDSIIIAIFQMGLRDAWRAVGATTLQVQSPHFSSGEGDSAGGPRPQRSGGRSWPTLVIEAGYSQTLQQMRQRMRWWFGASNHEVKIVLLAKLNRNARNITIEKWIEVPAQIRPGATNTRAAAQLEPDCSQTISITQNPGNPGNPVSYDITRGDLRLEFDLLFLRQPGGGESDIIISMERLRVYAECVWEEVV